jgi:hypothetical protein
MFITFNKEQADVNWFFGLYFNEKCLDPPGREQRSRMGCLRGKLAK